MNSKQRVFRALRRQVVPDRVPLQFDLCRTLLEAFGRKLGIPVHYTHSYYEDLTYRISANDLRIAMGSDCTVVGAGLPRGYQHARKDQGLIVNEFGMKMRQGPLYMEVVEPPLAHISSEEEARAFRFPDPLADGRYDDAQGVIEKYKDEYFVIGDLELTMFEMAWHLVGLEKFMVDLISEEPYVGVLLDKAKEFSIVVGKKLIALGVDAIWTGDDFGSQVGMIISPRMWRTIFKPRFKEVFDELRQANPDVIRIYHCDGAVAPILDDLIEIGMDVFNPVQPNVPGHDAAELKDRFGDRLSFFGAIDQQALLPQGTYDQIAADVRAKIQTLGRGGGYLIAPAHIVQSDTPPENVEAFINAVREYGVYD